MNDETADLLDILSIERLEVDLFRGRGDGGETTKRIFGGQVLAQSLNAANRSVDENRVAHSLHAYFLRSGDPKAPILYEVDRIRDGRSFSTRRVVAIQHGRPILNMAASFQVPEEGLEHQDQMPVVPAPEDLQPMHLEHSECEKLPDKVRRLNKLASNCPTIGTGSFLGASRIFAVLSAGTRLPRSTLRSLRAFRRT